MHHLQPPVNPGGRGNGSTPSRPALARAALALGLLVLAGMIAHGRTPAIAEDPAGFTNFETEPVRPLQAVLTFTPRRERSLPRDRS